MVDVFNFQDEEQNQAFPFKKEEPASRSEGLALSAQNAVLHSFLGQQFISETQRELEKNPDSERISPEQIPESFRSKFPNGTNKATLDFYQNVANKEDLIKDRLSKLPSGFLSSASQWIGGIAGASVTPTGMLANWVAPGVGGVVGKALAPVLRGGGKLVGTALAAARGAAKGATTFGTYGAIMGAQEYEFKKQMGDNPNPWMILHESIESAKFGGLLEGTLGGLGGAIELLRSPDRARIQEATIEQVAQDRVSNVEPIVKQSVYDNVKKGVAEGRINIESLRSSRDALSEEMERTREEIDSIKENIPKEHPLSIINDSIETLQKMEQGIATPFEIFRLRRYEDLDHLHDYIGAAIEHPVERSQDQNMAIEMAHDHIQEARVNQESLDKIKSELSEVNEKLGAVREKVEAPVGESPSDFPVDHPMGDFLNKKSNLEHRIDAHEKRQEELNSLKESLKDRETPVVKKLSAMLRLKDLERLQRNIDHQINVVENARPVTKESLVSAAAKMNSVDGDVFLTDRVNPREDEGASVENKNASFFEKRAQEYVDAGKVDKGVINQIRDDHNNKLTMLKKSRNSIKKVIDCLLGVANG